MKVSEMDFRKNSSGKQLNESEQRNRPKLLAADLTDPRPSRTRGKVQERVEELVARNADGEMNCLELAAGSAVIGTVLRLQRLARCEIQKQSWQQQQQQQQQQIYVDTDTESESD